MPAGANVIGIDKYVLKHFQRELMSNRMISILCQIKGSFAGMIDFYPEGQAPPSSCHTTLAGQTIFHLNYEIDRYPEIIETFRCENPLYVYVAWDSNTVVTAFVRPLVTSLLANKKDRVCRPNRTHIYPFFCHWIISRTVTSHVRRKADIPYHAKPDRSFLKGKLHKIVDKL